jgi:hypothetical protein
VDVFVCEAFVLTVLLDIEQLSLDTAGRAFEAISVAGVGLNCCSEFGLAAGFIEVAHVVRRNSAARQYADCAWTVADPLAARLVAVNSS